MSGDRASGLAATIEDVPGRMLYGVERHVPHSPQRVFGPLRKIGGRTGWYFADGLWKLRYALDRMFGGPGASRGRSDPERLQVGDAIDGWTVEACEPDRLLSLRADLKLPGDGRLRFEISPDGEGSTLALRAQFDPDGWRGRLYWWILYPAHVFVFRGMLRNIARAAAMEQDEEPRAPSKDVFIQPRQTEKLPPCAVGCPNGTDVREWVGTIAQHEKLGLTEEQAYERAWKIIVEVNPFPAVTGRICPHPCEAGCNREGKDGGVAVHRLERFIGDWAIERKLPLPRLEAGRKSESIAVVGAGPAGLSFAYQMASRGYPVTIYESHEHPGGMLRYGIPEYRLPRKVLDAEIGRIAELGVELKLSTSVGHDIATGQVTGEHAAVFLGIGAQRGKKLEVEGEDGPGVFTGVEYLSSVHCGRTVDLGEHVVVVGGGDTAVDAARVARRQGADVTLIYRRSIEEMPAGQTDVHEAQLEGVGVECFVAPVEIRRDEHGVRSVLVRRMRAGARDADGRHRPVPIEGSEFELRASAVIAAVAQAPDWRGLEGFANDGNWAHTGEAGRLGENCWAGGDVEGAGIASLAIASGRRSAEDLHARLRGLELPASAGRSPIGVGRVKPESYLPSDRSKSKRRPTEEWLTRPDDEIELGLDKDQVNKEAGRCLSCGSCFGCEQCWMYCAHDCFTRLEEVRPGAYFGLNLEACRACGKCIDVCPCGFLEDRNAAPHS